MERVDRRPEDVIISEVRHSHAKAEAEKIYPGDDPAAVARRAEITRLILRSREATTLPANPIKSEFQSNVEGAVAQDGQAGQL